MKLEEYIFNLFLEHDCIVVQKFGGFLLNSKSAHFSENESLYYPPSKKISFNSFLKHQDGLLANYISRENNCSYTEAVQFVEKEVAVWEKTLDQIGSLNIYPIGNFQKDDFGKLLFSSEYSPLLAKQYGLIPVPAKKISLIESKPIQKTAVKNSWNWKIAAVFIPFLIIGVVIAMSQFGDWKKISIKENNTSSFIGVSDNESKEEAIISNKYSSKTDVNEQKTNSIESDSITISKPQKSSSNLINPIDNSSSEYSANRTDLVSESISNEKNELQNNHNEKEVLTVENEDFNSLELSIPIEVKKYQVIVGAFSIEKNALKLIKKLREKGYNANFIGKNGRLNIISAEMFDKKSDAIAFKKEIRTDYPGVWIRVE